jgi:hypothetical protein
VRAELKIVRLGPGLGQVGHPYPVAADLLGDELQRVEAGHHADGPRRWDGWRATSTHREHERERGYGGFPHGRTLPANDYHCQQRIDHPAP